MRILIALLLVAALVGCKGSTPADTSAEKGQPPAPELSARQPKISVAGTILERIDVPGGMYLRLNTSGGEIWAAVSTADVKEGAEVTVVNGVPMDGFESKALKRTFDRIVFGTLAGAPAAQPNAPPLAAAHGTPAGEQAAPALQHPPLTAAPAETGEIKVKKAEGAEGRTVAEVFALRASLRDASVAVRGKVVKVNVGIMGRNWLHLRDGSGSRATQDDDLAVTTLDSVEVGDVVLVRGVVHLNRDFGAGYTYPVIVEDAKVSKQP